MTRNQAPSTNIKIVRLPGWAVPLVMLAGLVVVVVVGLLSLTLLVVLVPLAIVGGLAMRLLSPSRGARPPAGDDARTSAAPKHHSRDAIDADYEVIEPRRKDPE